MKTFLKAALLIICLAGGGLLPKISAQLAPISLGTISITVDESGLIHDLTVSPFGPNAFSIYQTGESDPIVTGLYSYTQLSDSAGQLIVTVNVAGVTTTVACSLMFTSPTGGAFSYVTSAGDTGSGPLSSLVPIDDPPMPPRLPPTVLSGWVITLTEGGESRDIAFAASGATFTQFAPGTVSALGTGTYVYTQLGSDFAQLTLSSTDDHGNVTTLVYNLNYSSPRSGTYGFATSTGQTGTGRFSNLRETKTGNPELTIAKNKDKTLSLIADMTSSTRYDLETSTDLKTWRKITEFVGRTQTSIETMGKSQEFFRVKVSVASSGVAPDTLAGRIIDFSAAGLGNERLTFNADGKVLSDAVPTIVGTFAYIPRDSTATLIAAFPNGDRYDLTLNFTSPTQGTWSGNQFFDNSDHRVLAGASFIIQN